LQEAGEGVVAELLWQAEQPVGGAVAQEAAAEGKQVEVQILRQYLQGLRTPRALKIARNTKSDLVLTIKRQWPPIRPPGKGAVEEIDLRAQEVEADTQSVLVRETFFRVGFTRCPPWSAGQSAELRGP
jgi:hypothetical protein